MSLILGQKIGLLTVIEKLPSVNKRGKWLCQCECGKEIEAMTCNLTRGHTKSCGCWRGIKCKRDYTTHHDGRSKEYLAWQHAKSRCYNLKNPKYPSYGGRAITVCDKWVDSYETFLSDMGRAPSPLYSLDRINVDGNYEKDNCRWATATQQVNNRRLTVYVTHNDQTLSLSDWAVTLGISYKNLHKKIRTKGYSIQEIINKQKVLL